jgi:DNA modification methylase
MAATNPTTAQHNSFTNCIVHGDCIEIMRQMPAHSVDFILTDPPYLVNYRDREGRSIQNDIHSDWLKPAMAEAYRVLRPDRLAIMYYGWTRVDDFFAAWRAAGFTPVGHIVFRKTYSSRKRFLGYQHEQAFLLAKGRPPLPKVSHRRCDRYAVQRQQTPSDTEASCGAWEAHSQLFIAR